VSKSSSVPKEIPKVLVQEIGPKSSSIIQDSENVTINANKDVVVSNEVIKLKW
jgi:hypothetical protein